MTQREKAEAVLAAWRNKDECQFCRLYAKRADIVWFSYPVGVNLTRRLSCCSRCYQKFEGSRVRKERRLIHLKKPANFPYAYQ